MDTFLQTVLANAVLAGLLALVVGSVARFVRRPEVVYWLWALVLIKLVTPPLLHVPILLLCGTWAPSEGSGSNVLTPPSGVATTVTNGRPTPWDQSERPSAPSVPGVPRGLTAAGSTSFMPEHHQRQSPARRTVAGDCRSGALALDCPGRMAGGLGDVVLPGRGSFDAVRPAHRPVGPCAGAVMRGGPAVV